MLKLGVNVDHVATVRQARLARLPNPLTAALACERGGAWGITAHLREDRRHICDADIEELVANVRHLNMEMAVTDEMVAIASRFRPHSCCLVPEKRQELTTEGGLDVAGKFDRVAAAIEKLHANGIVVSSFVDPDFPQLEAAKKANSDYVELHTGAFSNAVGTAKLAELDRLKRGAEYANRLGLKVNAGHGIDYENIRLLLEVPFLQELNIGHSIVGRAILCGIETAVREMLELMKGYSRQNG